MLVWYHKSDHELIAWGLISSRHEYTIILLNEENVNFLSKDILPTFYLPNEASSSQQRTFFVQWMEIDTEIYDLPKYSE